MEEGPSDRSPPLGRWTLFIIVATGVLVTFLVLLLVFHIGAIWAVAGIVAGVALAGFWSPTGTRAAAHPARPTAPQPFGKLARTAFPLAFRC